MSYGGDGYDDERGRAIPSQTRTRLPEQDGFADRRPAPSPGRSVVTIVGIVLILIAAIVFANRADDGSGSGGNGGSGDGDRPGANPTAPSGEQPVDGFTNGIPSGYPQTAQGAESAATNYAVALGGEGMFNAQQRELIVTTISASDYTADLLQAFNADYSPAFNERVGIDAEGNAPDGLTFVSRATPIGSYLTTYTDTTAEVAVWCSGLFGLAGSESLTPVRSSWFTITFSLVWENGDWKVTGTTQTEGPTPVPGDNRASGADEIAEAVEEYGGFTYAR
ncbi:hypothetical protein ACFV5N_06905 [Streptomyces sp. NPDC059853]|uniref:hypothetical protein n=1 Tax=Streptomyces sp. NPDC059853 TaxID=3346973 RepID=UPI00365C7CCC